MNKKYPQIDLFICLLFLYFLTLHADRLHVVLGGYTIRINNLLAFFLFALLLIRYHLQLLQLPKAIVYPLLAISASMALSLVFSACKTRCLFYLGWYGLTLLCYFLLPYLLVKKWDKQKTFTLYCISFICVGLYAVLQLTFSFFGIHDRFTDQFISETVVRPNAFCFEPSFYALYMTPFVFLYNYHFLDESGQPFFIFRKKSVSRALFINCIYLISTSTAVFFAYAVFFTLVLVIRGLNKKRVLKFIAVFSGCGLIFALIMPFMFRHFFLKFFFFGFMAHHSFFERWVGIENGWTIFLQNPLVGIGLGAYPPYLMDAFLRGDSAFNFVSMHSLIAEVKNPVKLFEAMNVFTELLASLGVIGLCAFGWLIFAIFRQIKKVNHEYLPLARALVVSLAVTLIVLQFNQGIFRTYIWTHLALTFAYLDVHSEPDIVYRLA